ncbi:MAG TPA: hypothetical protein VM261_16045 [Kofleriaceae bacterium]|nr:hypothetical protein [Kofleriaceae bacterium]
MQPILRRELYPAALLSLYPPQLRNANKQVVWDLVCPPDSVHAGTLELTRWSEVGLPATVALAATEAVVVPDVYDYGNEPGVWHVNFADPELFVAYGSSLLAQDELQCAEHPVLCSVREWMRTEKLPARTEEDGAATPVLIAGVERRCALDTRVLYGNRFAAASPSTVREHTRVITPPTRTNLIAIAAPVGSGRYAREQIERVVATAYTAFAAAVLESRRRWPDAPVEVRTGFWGCGAFGGNRELMTLLQLLAARMAGVDRVRFYTVTASGLPDFTAGRDALGVAVAAGASGEPLGALLERVAALDHEWGVGNGT